MLSTGSQCLCVSAFSEVMRTGLRPLLLEAEPEIVIHLAAPEGIDEYLNVLVDA